MTFILVTGSIMAVSIFLIYHLCRFIGIEMKWISLVLCAAMAFLVNAVAISMSPFLDRSHYLRLAILVVVAAAFVTFFNERLLQREEKAAAAPADIQPLPWTAEQPAIAAAGTADISDTPALPDSITTEAEPTQAAPASKPDAESDSTDTAAKHEADARTAAQAEEQAQAEEKAEQLAKARAAAKAEAIAKAEALQREKDEARRRAAEELKARQEAEKKAKAAAQQKAREEAIAREKEAALAAIHQELAAKDSLDSILDYAYDHAESSPEAAICAYQQAIARYPEDSYTPFLVIELGNLYKEQAAYHEAIETYRQALSLPIIAENDDMKQEFIKNTRYLTIVEDILSKHHALSTPFPDIPADIMQEIETEFQQSG